MKVTRNNVGLGLGVALVAFATLTFTSGQFVPGQGTYGAFVGTPAVTIANGSPGATISLDTEGTIDWLMTNAAYGNTSLVVQASSGVHAKKFGNWLHRETRALTGTGASFTSSSVAGTTFTATNADDQVGGNGGTTSSTTYWVIDHASATGFGFGTRVPAQVTQRVLRVYVTVFSCTVTTTATLVSSGVTNSQNFTIGAVQTNKVITITYVGGTASDELNVHVLCTTNAGSGSLSLGAITLAAT